MKAETNASESGRKGHGVILNHPSMNKEIKNISKSLIIVNELGLHARSSAKIAELAQHARSGVWLGKGAEKVDATSIIDMLTLSCSKGTAITLTIDDPADMDIFNAISDLIEKGFGE